MNSRIALPEVGLITSWHVPTEYPKELPYFPPPLAVALQEGITVLDLYFLSHVDIPWYAKAAGRKNNRLNEPHAFAASLGSPGIEKIAENLRKGLSTQYGARAVGRLPRFAAIATFFPNASNVDEATRWQAVKALRNTFYLASCLGCICVEIVGGAGVPGPKSRVKAKPEDYRSSRLKSVAQTLVDVFDMADLKNPLRAISSPDKLPFAAVELEPGKAFLLNDPSAYKDLRTEVRRLCQSAPSSQVSERLRLNVNVAHAFLIGYDPGDLQKLDLTDDVVHMHISDHGGDKRYGGVHTCDLIPGTFHNFEEYKPWLGFAIRRAQYPKCFSGVVSVELEAANEIDEVLRAVGITRRWLREAASELK